MTDVFIVGGGPAGLAAAIAARRKGLSVVVADGNRPPIDKACGEGLMPDTLAAAAHLSVDIPVSAGFAFHGVRFYSESSCIEARFPCAPALGLRRTVLHELLVDAAERAGVDLRWNTPVASLDAVPARWVVGADGAQSRVRRWAGLDHPICGSRRFASREHFTLQPWSDLIEVHWANGCQIYVTPASPNEICFALISRDPRLRLDAALERHFPALRARLRGAPSASRERGAVSANMRLPRVASGNVALIGDASGSVDAITGEGIGLVFKQAVLLADVLADMAAGGSLDAYNARHPGLAFRPRVMARMMLLMDRSPAVRHAAIAAMSAGPALFRKLLAFHVGSPMWFATNSGSIALRPAKPS